MVKVAILAIDQGTTSTRTAAFSPQGDMIASAQQEFPQIYPDDGWVEHDPEAIWMTCLETLRTVYKSVKAQGFDIAGIGITNQRETTLIWEKASGKPVYNAIVWQDRRTARQCETLKERYTEEALTAKTGLLFDPYFSATKAAWILDQDESLRERAVRGELAFGTVDSFLIYRLTGGKSHATDATNASRTNLFNIHSQEWDDELLALFDVPQSILPEVKDCADAFGVTADGIVGESLPILGVAGDQQAAAIGQCCFSKGMIKSTYGTGCFVLMNTGDEVVISKNRLLSTVAYRLGGKTTYALEGSIFMAGASVQWLRDELGLVKSAPETEALVRESPRREGVYLVPAFTGLGAPYWDPDARGAIFGLTRATNSIDIVRATLDSVCYQTHDLLEAMSHDGAAPEKLRVDGGMAANDWLMQTLSDIVDLPIDRPKIMETTALGAAYLAGLQAGVFESLEDISTQWSSDSQFAPKLDSVTRKKRIAGWSAAVKSVLTR
ncbi:MAG: glycerol kinase GlpK [Alphaproteobacteria bacterium]